MSFQIHSADGKALYINELDKEACELWGKEYHPKDYANPNPPSIKEDWLKCVEDAQNHADNWFDKIGHIIHEGADNWTTVREKFLSIYTETIEKFGLEVCMEVPGIGGHVNLINHWESKGYIPVPIKE